MTEFIFLRRERTDIPFGFKLQGGSDFSIPLSVLQITENSIADLAGLRPGDAILRINDSETSWMEHSRAKQEIIRAGNEIILTIQRNAVDTSIKVQHTPLSKLKSLPAQDLSSYSPPPLKRTDLTVQKEESIKIGNSHNRAPMPFNREVGNTITYQAAKPTNWQPGDYTKFMEPAPKNPTVTAVFHNPYNTPIGLYSDDNVFDAFSHQTKGIINPDLKNTNRPAPPQQVQLQHNRNVNSLSMRMLNSALDATQGTNEQPPSVFDLKSGYNPTGATMPKGFRSVQAPTQPPPEQRHAPMRKEYQVKHVKDAWIEPKIN